LVPALLRNGHEGGQEHDLLHAALLRDQGSDQPAERMADNHEMLGTVGQHSQRKVGVVLQPGARVVAREVNRQRLVPTRSRNACAVSA